MKLFDNIYNERQATYTEAGIGRPIPRPANASFLYLRYHNGVTFFDPFQSLKDFQGDLQAIFIKPMACYLLSWYHAGRCLYELGLVAIHLLTLSPTEAGKHAIKMIDSFVKSFVYDIMYYVELYTQALSFAIRCGVSIGTGIYNTGVRIVNVLSQASEKPPETIAPPSEASTIHMSPAMGM